MSSLSAQDNCVLKKDKDNFKIYNCPIENTKFKSVMADFELNTTISEYVDVVLDVEKYNEWHYKVVSSRLLTQISNNELIYYTHIAAPWPVSDRDLVLKLNLSLDSITGVLTVTLHSIPDYIPSVEDIVRVPQSHSVMTLTPTGKDKLKVHYVIQADPGGSLPAWLANTVSTQGPYETFSKLIERLENRNKTQAVSTGTADMASIRK